MTGDIKRYLNRQKTLGRSDKTLTSYEWRLLKLRDFIKGDNLGGCGSFSDVSAENLYSFYESLLAAGSSYATRRAIMATVKHFFAWLHESEKILFNPAADLALEKNREPELELPPTEAEVSDLLEAVQPGSYSHTLRRAILELIYGCGLRRSEVAELRLTQIDFARNLLLVRGKGDKERIVPIPGGTLRFLDLYLVSRPAGTGDALFLKESGEPVDAVFVDNLFAWLRQRVSRSAGAPRRAVRIHAHLLRHAFAVHLLRNGADVRVLQELLGHESIDDTARYLRLVKDDVKTAYAAAMEEVI